MDNRLFESAASASQPAIKGQEKSTLERRRGVDSRRSEKSRKMECRNRQ